MIKKRIFNLVIFLCIIFIFNFVNPIEVNAGTSGDNLINKISTGANTMISAGQNGMNSRGITIDTELIKGLAQFLQFIAYAIVIAYTICKAVKYGLSSPGERASARKELLRWIIICIVVIAAFPLFKLIVSVFDGSLDTSNIVNAFANTSQGLTAASANSPFMLILNTAFRIIQVGGIGYIVIRFTVIGIRYFTLHTTARDPKSKAEVKNELYNTVILAIIIFGAVGFFEILYRVFN